MPGAAESLAVHKFILSKEILFYDVLFLPAILFFKDWKRLCRNPVQPHTHSQNRLLHFLRQGERDVLSDSFENVYLHAMLLSKHVHDLFDEILGNRSS